MSHLTAPAPSREARSQPSSCYHHDPCEDDYNYIRSRLVVDGGGKGASADRRASCDHSVWEQGLEAGSQNGIVHPADAESKRYTR